MTILNEREKNRINYFYVKRKRVSSPLTSRGGRPLVAVLCPLAVPREVTPVAALVATHVGVEAATAAAASAAAAAALPAALLRLALEQKEQTSLLTITRLIQQKQEQTLF